MVKETENRTHQTDTVYSKHMVKVTLLECWHSSMLCDGYQLEEKGNSYSFIKEAEGPGI